MLRSSLGAVPTNPTPPGPGILADLKPLCVPIDDLKLFPGNPRIGNVEAIKASIAEIGVHRAIVVRRDTKEIIAGNHEYKAMKALGFTEVPVVWTDDNDMQARARNLADNHTGELGTYDNELLVDMLSYVVDDPALFAATAYTQKDVDLLLGMNLVRPGDAPAGDLASNFQVIITCTDETQQATLLEELAGRGLNVRAVVV